MVGCQLSVVSGQLFAPIPRRQAQSEVWRGFLCFKGSLFHHGQLTTDHEQSRAFRSTEVYLPAERL